MTKDEKLAELNKMLDLLYDKKFDHSDVGLCFLTRGGENGLFKLNIKRPPTIIRALLGGWWSYWYMPGWRYPRKIAIKKAIKRTEKEKS